MTTRDFDPATGLLRRAPERVVRYAGDTKRTIVAMAEGPDGLYFTDFFGDSVGAGNEPGRGTVWKIVPSEASLNLTLEGDQDLTVPERGRQLAARHCAQCYRLEGHGGLEGPELTDVATTLDLRLHSPGYEAMVRELQSSEQRYLKQQRWRLDEVMARTGQNRIRRWLVHHLEDPRIDNAFARMPSSRLLPSNDLSRAHLPINLAVRGSRPRTFF